MECPVCKEEARNESTECIHCGAFIDNPEILTKSAKNTSPQNVTVSDNKSSFVDSVVLGNKLRNCIMISVLILYVGGWRVVWGDYGLIFGYNAFLGEMFAVGHGFGIRFNHLYYGLGFVSRFFDAPIFSWLLFFISWAVFKGQIIGLFQQNDTELVKTPVDQEYESSKIANTPQADKANNSLN